MHLNELEDMPNLELRKYSTRKKVMWSQTWVLPERRDVFVKKVCLLSTTVSSYGSIGSFMLTSIVTRWNDFFNQYKNPLFPHPHIWYLVSLWIFHPSCTTPGSRGHRKEMNNSRTVNRKTLGQYTIEVLIHPCFL